MIVPFDSSFNCLFIDSRIVTLGFKLDLLELETYISPSHSGGRLSATTIAEAATR